LGNWEIESSLNIESAIIKIFLLINNFQGIINFPISQSFA